MNILRFYVANGISWTSPGKLWQAICRKEPIVAVCHHPGVNIPLALLVARTTLLDKFKHSLRVSARGAISCAICSLFLSWPIVRSLLPEIMFNIIQFFILGGMTMVIVQVFRQLSALGKLKTSNLAAYSHKQGPRLLPPPFAFQEIRLKPVLFHWVIRLLPVVILLNCWVIANPYKPAIISPAQSEPFVTEQMMLVPLGTPWKTCHRFELEETIIIVHAPSEEQIWILHIYYTVYRADLLYTSAGWQDWLGSRVRSIVNYVVPSVMQSVDPELSEEEQAQYLATELEEQNFIADLSALLYEQFNEHFEDHLQLYTIQIELKHIPLEEYQLIRERIDR